MEAQSPPSKIARVADSGMGSMERGSSLVVLGLGLGHGPSLNQGKSGFTFLQLQELEHQSLIFKYIVAGLPVPSHLIIPIWKSVVSSYDGVNGVSYHHYPSFLGCSSLCFDYKNSMEPEPGRCRRTDGKKWRCSKEVVPNQKYCERHMHRGRNRSRKHVETSQVTATATTNNTNHNMNSNTNLSISFPVSQLNTTTSNDNNNGTSSSNNNNNVSPNLGFSPQSVLQSGACKTESPM